MNGEAWPELDMERDSPTLAVPHLTSQMLGKIRVAHAPWSTTAGTRRCGRPRPG